MIRSLVGVAAAAFGALVLGGCSRTPADPAAQDGAEPARVPVVASVGGPPTDEECWAFAASFEEAALLGDPVALTRLIDWEAVAEEATDGIDAPDSVRQPFIEGLVASLVDKSRAGDGGFVASLLEVTQQGGTCTPLRVIGNKANKGVRFRLLTADDSLNYLDFDLARRADGAIKVVDILPYAVGETVSQSIRRIYLSVVADAGRNMIQRLSGKEQALLAHLSTLTQMQADIREGRHQAALTAYHALPEELQRERLFLVPRYMAASSIDDNEYAAALADLRRHYPDDPGADLLMIDSHFLQGEFDEALADIDRLERTIGGDPYLHVLRSGIHLQRDDLPEARAAIARALEEDPWLIGAYWASIEIALRERDFDETARLLDVIEELFEIEFFDLAEVPEYSEFAESPQYADWISRRSGPDPNIDDGPDGPPAEVVGDDPEV